MVESQDETKFRITVLSEIVDSFSIMNAGGPAMNFFFIMFLTNMSFIILFLSGFYSTKKKSMRHDC